MRAVMLATVAMALLAVAGAGVGGDASPGDACQGLALMREGDVHAAVPLLERAAAGGAAGPVALRHLAGAYGAIARRLASASGPRARKHERAALTRAASLFARADRTAEGEGEGGEKDRKEGGRAAGGAACERAHARAPALALRGWGDALAWLGRARESAAVFARGAARGVWRHPLCRPETQHATILRQPGAGGSGDVFFDARLFAHAVAPLLPAVAAARRELAAAGPPPRWRRRGVKPGGGWLRDSAGLRDPTAPGGGGAWLQLPLAVDGALRGGTIGACARGKAGAAGAGPWRRTCEAVRDALAASPALRLRKGQVKLSWMAPGTRVRPHAGPTDLRLRLHCTVALPQAPPGGPPGVADAAFRVADAPPRSWPRLSSVAADADDDEDVARFDECFVFREACEHAVRVPREAVGPRVVFIADLANPLLARNADYLGAALGVGEGGGPEGAAAVTAALAERDAFVRERWRRWRAQLSGRERDEL